MLYIKYALIRKEKVQLERRVKSGKGASCAGFGKKRELQDKGPDTGACVTFTF